MVPPMMSCRGVAGTIAHRQIHLLSLFVTWCTSGLSSTLLMPFPLAGRNQRNQDDTGQFVRLEEWKLKAPGNLALLHHDEVDAESNETLEILNLHDATTWTIWVSVPRTGVLHRDFPKRPPKMGPPSHKLPIPFSYFHGLLGVPGIALDSIILAIGRMWGHGLPEGHGHGLDWKQLVWATKDWSKIYLVNQRTSFKSCPSTVKHVDPEGYQRAPTKIL